ncbi:MAG: AAA family ATPase [Byssovorax sp.]
MTHPQITALTLENFRGFTSARLPLDRPLTVLVGINGAGKTSALDALGRLAGMISSARRPTSLTEIDIRRGAKGCLITLDGVVGGEAFDIKNSLGVSGESEELLTNVVLRPAEGAGSIGHGVGFPAAYYASDRAVSDRRYAPHVDRASDGEPPFDVADLAKLEKPSRLRARVDISYRTFFNWFRYREDHENEQRSRGNTTYQDRSLTAVRTAIERVVPGISRPRVQRIPYRLVATKNGEEYALDQLSDGERGLLALVGDLAYRLAVSYPDLADPLQGYALVLIDEIEQHLHPGWQRIILGGLQNAFPNCQFVVTTHSPQVLSEAPEGSVVVLSDFQFYDPPAPTAGRDTNSLLLEILGVDPHPKHIVDEIKAITALFDDGDNAGARARLDKLAHNLTERDPEVARLRTFLDIAERIDETS